MKNIQILLLLVYCSTLVSCVAQNNSNSVGIMFYNLENLYDTTNDPKKDDEIFLPSSPRNWDEQKYKKKLENLSKVIATGADHMPALVGLCEVENEKVLIDLIATENLKAGNYGYIHFDSPDERGIDVALLYDKNHFTPKKYNPIYVDLSGDSIDYTRDILFVYGEIAINAKKEPINIFVNHWPSRVEGEEVSAPKRAVAAQALKHVVDSLNNQLTDANIIIMGDFNDTPYDKSIMQILNAREFKSTFTDECLVNLMSEKQKNGEGSYNFKGKWQTLDQLIVSESLLDDKKSEVDINTIQFVKKNWMMFVHEKYGESPDRTFSGNNYIGGYSDHLPVYMELIVQ
ncbi:MAG: hypothetical protein H7Y00_08305 [Fimbriimonadaceae bacterium]|nr:hypothetical protein [Chitinophagales bacterium]